MERLRVLVWPFTHAPSSRNMPFIIGTLPSTVFSRTINDVGLKTAATDLERAFQVRR